MKGDLREGKPCLVGGTLGFASGDTHPCRARERHDRVGAPGRDRHATTNAPEIIRQYTQ